jgi:hypothetical protein
MPQNELKVCREPHSFKWFFRMPAERNSLELLK